MRILYGVVGEGMGHATRSRVVIAHLLASGHTVGVVASGRAFTFLSTAFANAPGFSILDIHGLTLSYADNALSLGRSVLQNLDNAPLGIAQNLAAALDPELRRLNPQVVLSDFESFAYFYGLNHFLPVISIDNMQIINRCTHPDAITADPEFLLAKAAVKVKLPGAWHYLITSFFFPPVRKERTTLIPPILRQPILDARREPQDHVLVYQTAKSNPGLLTELARLPGRFHVYGMGVDGSRANVVCKAFSEQGFVDDLRTARSAIAGGGFSLMSECVHLGVPLYAIPIGGQFEQELNARYLRSLGYGDWSPTFDSERIASFLASEHSSTYTPTDNQRTYTAVDTLLAAL